jgi:hypothetical protein
VTTLENQTNDDHISMTYCFWMVPNILLHVSRLKLRLYLCWFFGRRDITGDDHGGSVHATYKHLHPFWAKGREVSHKRAKICDNLTSNLWFFEQRKMLHSGLDKLHISVDPLFKTRRTCRNAERVIGCLERRVGIKEFEDCHLGSLRFPCFLKRNEAAEKTRV